MLAEKNRSTAPLRSEEKFRSTTAMPKSSSTSSRAGKGLPPSTTVGAAAVTAASKRVPPSSRRHPPPPSSPAAQQQHQQQQTAVGDGEVPAHSYTLALRSQWSSLVRLMRAHSSNANNASFDLSGGGGATMHASAATAAALAVESGLDEDMCSVLSAIRGDAVNAAVEADALFPLLLALAIAPIPTEAIQTLAAEVLAKVLVAAYHGSVSTRRTIEAFLVQNKVMQAMALAMESSSSAQVSTSILELIFVIVTVSSASATVLLADPAMLKHILGLLVSGVPAQVCYVAALLQTLARLPDAAQILCSYHAHHCVLAFLYDNQEDDVTVTAVTMMLRVAVVLLQRCPAVFRQVFQQPALVALLVRLLRSPWGDVADLGCLLLSSFLQQRTVAAAEHHHHHRHHQTASGHNNRNDEGLASPNDLAALAATVLGSGGSKPSSLVVTLSSLCAAPHRHLATSASYALLLLGAHAVTTLSEHLCSDATALHNIVTTILEDADDDDNDGDVGGDAASWGATDAGHNNKGDRRQRGDAERGPAAGDAAAPPAALHRGLTAALLCLTVAAGTAKGRISFGQHVHRHLSLSTRTALCNRVRVLLSDRVLQDSVFGVVEHVRPLLDAAQRMLQLEADEAAGAVHHHHQRLRLNDAEEAGGDDDLQGSLVLPDRKHRLQDCLRRTLIQKLEQWVLGDSVARHGGEGGGHNASHLTTVAPLDRSNQQLQHLVRDEPRANVHSSSFVHNSIRVVVRLARNYTHGDAVRGGGLTASGATTTAASSTGRASNLDHSSHHRNGNTTRRSASAAATSSCSSTTSTSFSAAAHVAAPANAWAPPHKHNVDRRWSVEHLQRDDVYLFDCPLERLTPGLQDVMDGLTLHIAKLHHALNVCSMSHPMRRCVLLDLYTHVYPTMMTCCQYIAQSLGHHNHLTTDASSGGAETQHQFATSAAVRVIADGGAHSIHSANILDVYHAIGLSTHFE